MRDALTRVRTVARKIALIRPIIDEATGDVAVVFVYRTSPASS